MNRFLKAPNSRLDYSWDWSDWLDQYDEIDSATVSDPDGITVDNTVVGNEAVTVWLTGGTEGETYELTCSITTKHGREDERKIYIAVRRQ